MSEEAFERLEVVISELSDDFAEARVEIDEIYHLTQACRARLPSRFITLVNDADKSPPSSQRGFSILRNRLITALRLDAQFPITPDDKTAEAELLPTFQLPVPDKERVLKLCDQIRKIIHNSAVFDVPHKKRLLDRVAAIEKQVHSPKGLYDVVLGGVSDFGETLGKFRSDIKPLTDRIQEIKKITRKNSKQYDQLPEPKELQSLPSPEEHNDQEAS